MSRIFAIGDIHGCCLTFKKLIWDKIRLTKGDVLYCVGDYIDRGEDSKGVIDFIIELRKKGFSVFTLRGNHEQMMLDAVYDSYAYDLWISNGGKKTLQSFAINSLEEMDEKYWNFFHETQLYFETDKYIFVHAGLNFFSKNIFADKDAMLWIRDFHCNSEALNNRQLVHGHTPIALNIILNQKTACINIDGGCVFPKISGLGNLVALELPAQTFVWQKNCE